MFCRMIQLLHLLYSNLLKYAVQVLLLKVPPALYSGGALLQGVQFPWQGKQQMKTDMTMTLRSYSKD